MKSEPRPENVSCCVLLEHQAAENKEFETADSKEFFPVFSFRQRPGLVNEKLADEANDTNGNIISAISRVPKECFASRAFEGSTRHTKHPHFTDYNRIQGGGTRIPKPISRSRLSPPQNEKILSMKDKKT